MIRKRNIFIILLSFCLLLTALFLFIRQTEINTQDNLSIVVKGTGFTQNIRLYPDGDCYYAFLPSCGDIHDISIDYPDGCKVFLNNQYVPAGYSLENIQLNKKYYMEIKNWFDHSLAKYPVIILKSENVSSLFLKISNGNIEDINRSDDKSVKKSGSCTMINSFGKVNYNGDFSALKGHGNTTWKTDKKSYDLCFEKSLSLFDSVTNNKFCLLSNSFDQTNLRNKIVYDTAKKTGLPYVVDSEYIDLYIDGNYMGLYLLTEDISIGDNGIQITDLEYETQILNDRQLSSFLPVQNVRSEKNSKSQKTTTFYDEKYFDIPENPSDITGGYLIRLENNYRLKNADSGFSSLNHNYGYRLCSPKYASHNQLSYIRSLINTLESDTADEAFQNTIHPESWVLFYLLNEVFANSDSGSMYFYKDSDSVDARVYAGPVWDFDLSMGQYFGKTDPQPKVLYKNNFFLFRKLFSSEEYYQLIKNTYRQSIRTELVELCEKGIHNYCSGIANSFEMNRIRWNNCNQYDWIRTYDSIDKAETEIKSFLSDRISFLDSIWIDNNEPPATVFFTSIVNNDSNTRKNFYFAVTKGDKLHAAPTVNYNGKKFVGWYNNQSGEKLDINAPVLENMQFVAVWE